MGCEGATTGDGVFTFGGDGGCGTAASLGVSSLLWRLCCGAFFTMAIGSGSMSPHNTPGDSGATTVDVTGTGGGVSFGGDAGFGGDCFGGDTFGFICGCGAGFLLRLKMMGCLSFTVLFDALATVQLEPSSSGAEIGAGGAITGAGTQGAATGTTTGGVGTVTGGAGTLTVTSGSEFRRLFFVFGFFFLASAGVPRVEPPPG